MALAIVWSSNASVEAKENLIISLYDLYENLYQYNFSEPSGSMWWNSLAYQFHADSDTGQSRGSYSSEKLRIQDVMFETIKRILVIPSSACQGAALHGLEHMRHPDTEQVIMDYIKSHPGLSKEDRQYTLACITGEII